MKNLLNRYMIFHLYATCQNKNCRAPLMVTAKKLYPFPMGFALGFQCPSCNTENFFYKKDIRDDELFQFIVERPKAKA